MQGKVPATRKVLKLVNVKPANPFANQLTNLLNLLMSTNYDIIIITLDVSH